ncbi:MAG TPA: fused MFS/spermidine synthase [Roseiflexaceae bacterium]|nr:fused MFS/spermidine synthase [Roseiflexaceae bacterium]
MNPPSPDSAAPARDATLRSGRFLLLVVFLAGVGTLGVEMLASRLLAPFFGTSQPIWAVVIGMTLIYLALGYHLGGRLADRRPDERVLYRLIVLAGVLTALIPPLARPILGLAQSAVAQLAVGGFLGALFGVLLLFAAPVTLLAMVSPFAVRLQLHRAGGVAAAGSAAGTISALSTVGSIVGTFLTALYLIPTLGSAATTFLFAALLAALGALGLRDWRYLLALGAVAALAAFGLSSRGAIKTADCRGCELVYEAESGTNYIQVATRQHPRFGEQVVLLLNEGLAVHSIYNTRYERTRDPLDTTTGGGPWDYFAVAPYFVRDRRPEEVTSLAMLGAAAGTVPAQFLALYGPDTRVDAVEIDPAIVALARRFFGVNDAAVGSEHPNYHIYAEDARFWLATRAGNATYDVIGMDAYHQPYIPFHLTTVEFFQLVRSRLTPDGVAVVNAGVGPDGDTRLGESIAATMSQVFPQVYIIDTPRQGNQIIVGVSREQGDGLAHFVGNYGRISEPALRAVMETVVARRFDPAETRYTPFTDDRAPVEALIDSLIFKTVLP